MQPLEHFRLTKNLNTSYFALDGHYIGVRLFWMPMITEKGSEIKLPVIADAKTFGTHVKDYTKIPVLRVEHVSEDIVNRSVGILSIFTTNVLRIISDESPIAFAGIIPNVRHAKEGERFIVPIAVDVQQRFNQILNRNIDVYVLHMKAQVKLASSYTDAIQKEFWDHALNVPAGMRWGELCEQVAEGRLSFPVKLNPIYIDTNLESVPQEVVDRVNERKLQ